MDTAPPRPSGRRKKQILFDFVFETEYTVDKADEEGSPVGLADVQTKAPPEGNRRFADPISVR